MDDPVEVVEVGHGVGGLVGDVVGPLVVLSSVTVEVELVVIVVELAVTVLVEVELAVTVVVEVELAVTGVVEVELLSVMSLQSPSTPPVLPLLQESGNFCLHDNRQEAPMHVGISKVPSGIGLQPSPSQQ